MKKYPRLIVVFLLSLSVMSCASDRNRSASVRYRGFTVLSLEKNNLSNAVDNWHANQVRLMMWPQGRDLQSVWKKMVRELPAGLDNAKELGLAVVLDLHAIPNDHPRKYSDDPTKASHEFWYDEGNRKVLIDCWREIAEICKDRDQVIWFDLLNEPLDWTIVHSEISYPPTWPDWAQATIDAIRKIDRRHPVVVEPGPGMLCWGFKGFPVLKDPCQPVIYSTHMYQPFEYTHQGIQGTKILGWPGPTGDHGGGGWDKQRLETEMSPAIEFQKKNKVRIYIGEFSAARWAPGAAAYLRSCLELFEQYGWDWSYHSLDDAYVWRLEESDEVNLYDAQGKYVKTGLAVPDAGLFYAPYSTPVPPKPLQELTDRGQVLKQFLDTPRSSTSLKP